VGGRGGDALNRTLDVAIAGAGLALASPLLAAAALAVKLGDGGPVLFKQTRVGKDGRDFELLKLRTMVVGAERQGAGYAVNEGDSRITRAGRFLRRTSLDELPQLWNVVRGDMSLVGPRPERPYFVEEFTRQYPWYTARHRVPAGLTGWAQIHGLRGDTSIGDRSRFDNFYIENWSLWGDIKILLRTVGQVVRGGGR
jgi:exopolysaccharide biosynthesis polyprenyl glycosylphosphotransferase